ncbi:hypothetical protein GTQ40_16215 [Flavobacteriaceae bacterium R38]|nr:hypothetical protein [Flavobacteriaceae bacterium R38]
MKNLFFLLFFGLISYKSQYSKLNENSNCLDTYSSQVLAEGLIKFEKELEKKYSGLKKEKQYIVFLKDFIDKKLPPSFFQNPDLKSINKKIKKLNIWVYNKDSDDFKIEEIRLDESEPEESGEFLSLNKSFQSCLIQKISNKGIKNFLTLKIKVPDINPFLSVKFIRDGINEKDLENKQNRLAIALGVYYEFGINL